VRARAALQPEETMALINMAAVPVETMVRTVARQRRTAWRGMDAGVDVYKRKKHHRVNKWHSLFEENK